MSEIILTERLELVPVTLEMVEAILLGDRARAEAAAHARLPEAWPNRSLIERAFTASLEAIRTDPDKRLWGDRLMIARNDPSRLVIGSVVFNGFPDDGVAHVGYGVEEARQREGYATEATRACVEWALQQEGIRAVIAETFPWHQASLRVIEKLGMKPAGKRLHELLGEILLFEVRR
jgi:RimJ/RimL family protein N-acetyltransferase